LLKALTRRAQIDFGYPQYRWILSGKGVASVLLKMDEFRGQLGAVGDFLGDSGAGVSVFKPKA
jgi:hypothetical protein